jgi:hypothetical protein
MERSVNLRKEGHIREESDFFGTEANIRRDVSKSVQFTSPAG